MYLKTKQNKRKQKKKMKFRQSRFFEVQNIHFNILTPFRWNRIKILRSNSIEQEVDLRQN